MKTINWIITANKWERGTDINELMRRAKKNMGIRVDTHYVRYIGVIKDEATEEEVSNLQRCWNVDDWGGLKFWTTDAESMKSEHERDREMAKRLFVGWITEEYNKPKAVKIAKKLS